MPEAVRIERASDSARHQLVRRQPRDPDLAQDGGDLPVRLVVELLVGHPHPHLRAESLLHRFHPADELRERGRARSAALHPGAGDVGAVAGKTGAGVDEQ